MIGTHQRDYEVVHKLNKTQIADLEKRIYSAVGDPGTLVIGDINGFHSNCPRKDKRRVIMYEFQELGKLYIKSSTLIPSYWLTDKIRKNLDLFVNNLDSNKFEHTQDLRLKKLDPSIDSFLFITPRLFKPWLKKQFLFWKYQLKKIISKLN